MGMIRNNYFVGDNIFIRLINKVIQQLRGTQQKSSYKYELMRKEQPSFGKSPSSATDFSMNEAVNDKETKEKDDKKNQKAKDMQSDKGSMRNLSISLERGMSEWDQIFPNESHMQATRGRIQNSSMNRNARQNNCEHFSQITSVPIHRLSLYDQKHDHQQFEAKNGDLNKSKPIKKNNAKFCPQMIDEHEQKFSNFKYPTKVLGFDRITNVRGNKKSRNNFAKHMIDNKSRKNSRNQYIEHLQSKVKKLEQQLRVYRAKQEEQRMFQQNVMNDSYEMNQENLKIIQQRKRRLSPKDTEAVPSTLNKRITPNQTMQFQQMDFSTLMSVPGCQEMQEKSWIFLGTIMIVMGSQIIDYDGTINVFKIVKQAADQIRRQVQKCNEKINLEFFTLKEQINLESKKGMAQGKQEFGFDPFFQLQDFGVKTKGGLQSEAVRVQSVQESELCFTQKVSFSIKYEALIKAMEYMKGHSWFIRDMC